MSVAPTVYFILGTPGSGRRALVRDLAENGLADEKVVVLLSESERPDPADDAIAKLKHVEVQRWKWQGPDLPRFKLPATAAVFFLADPLASPVDQVEALKPWLVAQGRELARVFCCVDCQLAEKQPVLMQWFEACIRFADIVFLTNRTGVANKWLSDFVQHFKSQFFPCLFIQVKKGDLPNPALVLDPTPRRLSQYFDEAEDYSDIEIETDDEEDEDDADVDDGLPEKEPYFERLLNGHRAKEVPDVRDFLPKK